MKIIYLDDMETRHAAMDFLNDGSLEIIHVRSVEETMEAIAKNPKVDILFLDHDLGYEPGTEYQRAPGTKGTGSEVAELLTEVSKEVLPKLVVLHTHNNAGAQYMYQTLRKYVPMQWRPFGTEITDLLFGPQHTNV